jgi:hypothetical protein
VFRQINLFFWLPQNWLQLPADGTLATEDDLVSSQAKTKTCCLVDPGFDTSDTATFASFFTEAEKDALKPVVWRRVTGQLVVPHHFYTRVVQVRNR